MTDIDTLILDLQSTARSVARSFAKSYPPCDADDIEQTLMLWLVEHRAKVAAVFADSGGVDGRKVMRKAFERTATDYCRGERAAAGIIHNAYWYRPVDVREALPYWFNHDYWSEYAQTGGPDDGKHVHGARSVNGGNTRTGQVIWHNDKAEGLAVLGDISRCFERLTETHRDALEAVHLRGVDNESGSADERRYYRAVDALTELMNGVR